MRFMKKIIITIICMVAVGIISGLIFMYSGAYNISTSNHDNALVNWVFDTAYGRSVKQHAHGVQAPDLSDPARVQEGFEHYDEMCVQCHGAPGKSPDEIAKGLWPKAPDLGRSISDWTPAQAFWIVKNGVKFTAMPAWGPTHSDEKIWSIVAFLEKLPNITPEQYERMERKTSGEMEKHEAKSPSGANSQKKQPAEQQETNAPSTNGK